MGNTFTDDITQPVEIKAEITPKKDGKNFDLRKDYFQQMYLHEEMLKMKQLMKNKINADELRVENLQLKIEKESNILQEMQKRR